MKWRRIESILVDILKREQGLSLSFVGGKPLIVDSVIDVEELARELAYRLDTLPPSCA
jgi:hypothetical protein